MPAAGCALCGVRAVRRVLLLQPSVDDFMSKVDHHPRDHRPSSELAWLFTAN